MRCKKASLRVLAEREIWVTRVVSSYRDDMLSMQSFCSSCMDSSVIATRRISLFGIGGGGCSVDYIHYSFGEILVAHGDDDMEVR